MAVLVHTVLLSKVKTRYVCVWFCVPIRVESRAWGDPSLLLSAKRGNVVQLQRKGFFIVDEVGTTQ